MTLFLRAHRAGPGVVIATLIAVAAWQLAGGTLPLPQLVSGRIRPVHVELLVTVLQAPMVLAVFAGRASGPVLVVEAQARRTLWPHDLLLAATTLAPAAVVAAAATATGDTQTAAVLLRDTAFFTGMTLALLAWPGHRAALLVPVIYFLLVGTIGTADDGTTHWWAALRDPATPATLIAACALAVVGVVLFHRAARSRAARQGR